MQGEMRLEAIADEQSIVGFSIEDEDRADLVVGHIESPLESMAMPKGPISWKGKVLGLTFSVCGLVAGEAVHPGWPWPLGVGGVACSRSLAGEVVEPVDAGDMGGLGQTSVVGSKGNSRGPTGCRRRVEAFFFFLLTRAQARVQGRPRSAGGTASGLRRDRISEGNETS